MPAFVFALIGGLGAGLGHAPFHLWFVAFPAFALLIWTVSSAPTARASFLRAWAGATAYFGLTLQWIVEPFLVDAATHGWMAPFALLLMAGGLALFWGLAGWAAYRLGSGQPSRAFALALTMTLAELLRGHVLTGFPWAMPAYIWGAPETIWTVAYIGSYGLTLATLALAAALTLRGWMFLGPITTVLVIGAVWLTGASLTPYQSQPLGTVGLIHPNVPQTEKWKRQHVPEHIARLRDLTETAAARGSDLIILPEVAVVYPLDQAGPVLQDLANASGQADLITGINRRDGDDWMNALVRLNADGVIEETYDKVHLVPFGEYIPLRLGFVRALAAASSNGFTAGSGVRLIDTPLGRTLPLICYEGIFPGHLFKAGERADYLLVITNDAWFGTFAGPVQHFDQARFRAVEQGLSVVRVANRGTTAVIDPQGTVLDSLQQEATGALVATVPAGRMTVYAKTGNIPLFILLFLALIALSLTKWRNAIAKPANPA